MKPEYCYVAWLNRQRPSRHGFLKDIYVRQVAEEIVEVRNSLHPGEHYWVVPLPDYEAQPAIDRRVM